MNQLFEQAKLIIFDLDGTLYEDTDHFEYYAEQLALHLPTDIQADYMAAYWNIAAGKHIVSIGKVYDAARDLVLKVDAFSLRVLQAWNWQGEELQPSEVSHLYPRSITLNFDSMIAIGDGWWLPVVCAKHFGAKSTQSAYVRTKEYMATELFQLTRISGLREALIHLGERKKTVLLTNSAVDDVARLLKLLDLDHIFSEIITEGNKPGHTTKHFMHLMDNYHVSAEQCLSIGDNFINEIAPAWKLGIKTIFIDFYNLHYPEYSGVKVSSISDIIPLIRQLP